MPEPRKPNGFRLRRSGRDCRNPGYSDANRRALPGTWTPALPAGVTTKVTEDTDKDGAVVDFFDPASKVIRVKATVKGKERIKIEYDKTPPSATPPSGSLLVVAKSP